MIEIGTLVKWSDGSIGIVTEILNIGRGTQAYRVKWFDGASGVLSARQFEVIA